MSALDVVCLWLGRVVFAVWVACFLFGLVKGCVDGWREHRKLAADRRFVAATAQPLIHEPTVTDWDTELESLIRNIGGTA